MFKKIEYYLLWGALVAFQPAVFAEEAALEDPTRPVDYVRGQSASAAKKSVKSGSFSLDAIIVSGDYKVAIINEKIVKIGDSIGVKKVVSIDSDKVVLAQEKNQDLVLQVSYTPVKEASK